MILARTRADLRRTLDAYRASGETVALVPTMGALHLGHLSLFDHAGAVADRCVVSIFVNPLQFDRSDDLADYPRDLERDLELATAQGVDLVFAPDADEIYPPDACGITVDPGPWAERLEGAHREGHFRGVLTVVTKLFGIVGPDVAIFGQKDFQQGVMVRRLVEELALGVDVRIAPTVREADGLALSSRNLRLSAEARTSALSLSRGLRAIQSGLKGGERSRVGLLATARGLIEREAGVELEYLEIVDARTLDPADPVGPGDVATLAAHVGGVRLIDNLVLE